MPFLIKEHHNGKDFNVGIELKSKLLQYEGSAGIRSVSKIVTYRESLGSYLSFDVNGYYSITYFIKDSYLTKTDRDYRLTFFEL